MGRRPTLPILSVRDVVALRVLVNFGAGAVLAGGLWWALRTTFAAPVFARLNHRGVTVPVGAGIIIALVPIAMEAVGGLLDVEVLRVPVRYLVTALGFGALGFFDDIAAAGTERGFGGHLRAMRRGRLTTGGLKLVGGGLLGLVVGAHADPGRPLRILVDGALIALAANAGNLLDRAPGRTIKVALVAFAGLWAANRSAPLGGTAAVVGAGAGLLVPDLSEQLMLGDAGANVLGAVLGVGVVLTTDLPMRLVVLGLALALNVAGELVSFSTVIDRVSPLRFLDRLGRTR